MKQLAYIFLLALVVLPSTAAALDGFPEFPMAFWGNVTVGGTAAPAGTVIRAYYGNTLAGSATVQEAGVYGYTGSTEQKLVVVEGSGTIIFKVQSAGFNSGAETGGDVVQSHSGFTSGATVEKNLAFSIAVPANNPDPSSNSGGGGSGGGGGGGGFLLPPATGQTGDASGDGNVDILDFNALLIQWGRSGASLTADFDKNGIVDILDFNLLLINWTT